MKPQIGMKVRPKIPYSKDPREWDGIIVVIIEPSGDDHGLLQTWLINQVDYGSDNCEHYAYYGEKDFMEKFYVID